MYRHARRGRWGYQCDLYRNSQSKCCSHNVVGGEVATGFILACVRQRVLTPTALAKLEARLREIAAAETGDGAACKRAEADRSRLAAVERKHAIVGPNLALAETTEEHAATTMVFRELQAEAAKLRVQIQSHRPPEAVRSPEREVEAAMASLDRFGNERLSEDHLGAK